MLSRQCCFRVLAAFVSAAPGVAFSVCLAVLLVFPLTAQQASIQDYGHQLSELTARRRTNVHFKNDQTIFRGVQVSNVNVGAGNLTFARKDLVVPGRVPIVVARVYDSSAGASADFGAGWILSAAERIEVRDRQAVLYDETASGITFEIIDNRLLPTPAFPNDFRDLRLSKGGIEARFRDGRVKQYSLVEGAYRLTSYTDRNGNVLKIAYAGTLISRLENATHWVEIRRNAKGQIEKVVADSGRQVSYQYDKQSRLIAVRDVGGDLWRYEYDGRDLLRTLIDPAERTVLRVKYSAGDRVSNLENPAGAIRFDYDDKQRLTTLIDRKALTSRFFQNELGITTRLVNSLGEDTRIELDTANHPQAVYRNGVLQHSIEYDSEHRISRRLSAVPNGTRVTEYGHDNAGRLVSVRRSNQLRTFSYDSNGNVLEAKNGKDSLKFSYTPQGDLRSFEDTANDLIFEVNDDGLATAMVESGEQTTRFAYNEAGELSGVEFSNGRKVDFRYKSNGLRTKLQYANGSSVKYSYDAAGNLIATAVLDAKHKQVNGQSFVLDNSYAIVKRTFFTGGNYTFEYDRNGNVTSMNSDAGGVTRFGYDALDRLIEVRTPEGKILSYEYQPGEFSLVDEYAHGAYVASGRTLGGHTFSSMIGAFATRQENSTYGVLRFAERLGTFVLADSEHYDIATPELAIAKALQDTRFKQADGVELAKRQAEFMRPVNKLFMPAEYFSINCCPQCPIGGGHPECGPECEPGLTPFLFSITPQSGWCWRYCAGNPFGLKFYSRWCFSGRRRRHQRAGGVCGHRIRSQRELCHFPERSRGESQRLSGGVQHQDLQSATCGDHHGTFKHSSLKFWIEWKRFN